MVDIGNARPDNDKPKEPIYKSAGKGWYYCILRLGKSYKLLGQITGFEKHMERQQNTPNANLAVPNQILVGGVNLADKVRSYISDCRYMTSNTTIAREMLLTASPDFFRGMSERQIQEWANVNLNWLNKKYGTNIIYATLHRDERTPHIHVLMCPKVYNESRKCYTLSSYKLFGTKEKLRDLQTEYADEMKLNFRSLNRGVMNSKAKHIEIKHFYGILNNVKARENSEEIFKHNILLNAKLKALEATLKSLEELLRDKEKTNIEVNKLNLELSKQVKDIKKDRDIYKGVVKQLSQTYHLPQNAIEKTLKYIQQDNEMHR